MAERRNWTWDETLQAFLLYMMLPKKELDDKGDEVIALAERLGRSPNAVALKIWNIAAHDENRLAQGKVGMKNGSKLDAAVWDAFREHGDELLDQALSLFDERALRLFDNKLPASDGSVPKSHGETREAITHVRVGQGYFRNSLIASYGQRCCITGIELPELLVASHIKPWKDSNPQEKVDSSNGLLLNALHDKAFDKGLITLDSDYRIRVSTRGRSESMLASYDKQRITLPSFALPGKEYIEYHSDVVFRH